MASPLHLVSVADDAAGSPEGQPGGCPRPHPVDVDALRTIMRVTPRRRRVAVALAFLAWEQKDVAEAIHAHPGTVSRWVHGTHLPKLLECEALADVCGLTLGEMWGD